MRATSRLALNYNFSLIQTMYLRGYHIKLLFLWWGLRFSTFAQIPSQLTFDNYTQREGLASDITVDALKDKRGFLWIVTRNGLCRYDGLHFKNYTYNPTDIHGIRGRRLYAITADSTGRIWVSMETGVCYYDETHDNFQYVYYKKNNGRWVFMPILADGPNIWIAANGAGLMKYNWVKKRLFATKLSERKTNYFLRLFKSRKGDIWVGTIHSGLFRYFPKTNTYKEYAHQDPNTEYSEKNEINSITEDAEGKIWVGSEGGGVQSLEVESGQFALYFPEQKNLKKPFAVIKKVAFFPQLTGDSILWCATFGKGLFTFNIHTHVFTKALVNPPLETNLVSPFVNNFYLDNQKNLWIMTQMGVSKVVFDDNRIRSLKLPFLQELGNPYIDNSIFELKPDPHDSNILWMASWGCGVLKYDFKRQKLLKYYLNTDANVGHRNLRSVYFDHRNRLWAGTEDGLFWYDPVHDSFQEFALQPSHQGAKKVIYDIVSDASNTLWVASSGGILRIDAQTQRVQQFSTEAGLSDFVVNRLLLDNQQNLWVATRKGLNYFNTKTHKITQFIQQNPTNDDLNVVLGMAFDQKGKLWIAARGGLSVLDVPQKTFKNFTEKEGFNASQCNDLFIDSDQNVWISTQGNLYVFDQKNRNFRQFTVNDGLFGSFMYDRISAVNGQLFVNFIGAVSYFRPSKLLQNPASAPLVFTGFKVLEQEIPFNQNQVASSPINIHYDQNIITFEFTALDFINPQKAVFSHKLEGFANDWSAPHAKHTITYTNLDGGDYTFWVRTLNDSGKWNAPISFKISIEPPFWKTWWFRALTLTSLLGILYWFYRAKLIQERREASIRQQRAEAENKALRAQMNPHFVFNCMNTIEYYILSNQADKASAFLQNFSLLVRNILENSQYDLIPLTQELDTLKLYIELEKERAEGAFSYDITLDETVPNKCQLPPLILQPFVENAILHGLRHKTNEKGQLSIRIWQADKSLWVEIQDNGVGRKAAAEIHQKQQRKKQSLGMKVTADRISALPTTEGQPRGAFKVEDIFPTGTRVTIQLPLYL
ncbi:sensor histidine kinase [Runella salmonicolor]|uniref:Histidine kinase n=1 Tax=Runella salmonicolor TaxID=2950278 RepID=A0ABT1FP39_9BACT|nr:sensor histidine kinase [Runella salmonicolor]MCP1383535.1 histidine kinase [Runella salmonicolor]